MIHFIFKEMSTLLEVMQKFVQNYDIEQMAIDNFNEHTDNKLK